ncbi:RimJ/RimL family protein N-acetyltransferase [Streptosporangium becharense]|uniref:RimJ/RimL family protein N-acetyltransferase n=1 Tax=Streptosporangium becharense TaxID=1816182 RepID=A0A7W9IJT3_9ACTN|nr:GNAT family protein [Streptosporangium becharense]MBB2911207.1 RimJ/RimL family protein N-acetyltransferase [Streptosporangium becharense]MBB5821735.1 RimJ/RimL family protein N-acetyltransferase [Streptosporangium becharense]
MTTRMPAPAVLHGDVVRLEPLDPGHVPDLFLAGGGDEEVWRWLPAPAPRTEGELEALAKGLIDDPDHVPHAVILRETGRAVGWTCYLDTPGYADSIEIGWTWYGRAVWRSAVNTECKILLIDHAFDKLGVNRVQLKTDILNTRSQTAIRRIGGVSEGVLRRQRRRPDGTWRDTAYFSILDDEWPAHRARLTSLPR